MTTPAVPDGDERADASDNPAASRIPPATSESPVPPPDDLPEWEPLSPELVEDEAIRGDFVMRWAVVGLALLLGCSQIAETKSLVHIRTGEYLAGHGFLPPANDVFAYTRADQPWINLSWLFDLLAAGIHGLGGGIALSIFQAVIAVAAFSLLVHTTRPGIRTWWGSICAALALLACFRQFTIQPELITLLGVTLTLWLLVRTQEGVASTGIWALVPLLWLWSQLDSRAYLGIGLLLAYGSGELIGAAVGRPGLRDATRRRQFWIVTVVAVLAAGLHPFTWHVWASPWTVYGVEYPAWRAAYPVPTRMELGAYPLWSEKFWIALNYEGVAGLYLMVAALVTMLLNFRRTPIAHVAIFLLINIAALPAGHGLAAASLVNCVLATLNAQDWYVTRYGQTYSIQWSFLLFSRGGRAITVLGMFAIAYLVISGRIDGPNGKRTGIGFDNSLLTMMDGYQGALADSYDDRPFPFVIRQGDLIIWAGRRTFIDSRLELFAPGGADSLLALHSKTRSALRRKNPDLPGSGDRSHWRKVFDQYEVTHVVPRLSGLTIAPNYRTFDDLLRSLDWKLTRLSPAIAVFYRTDLRQDRALRAYVEEHLFDPVRLAFEQESTPVTDPHVWPLPTTAYQQMLSLSPPSVPGPVAEAGHNLNYAIQDSVKLPQRLGAIELAVRNGRAGLRIDPNSSSAYRTLGTAYSVLDQIENGELRRYGIQVPHLLRYYQIVSAYQSALLLQPDDPALHQELAGLYMRVEKRDLALTHFHRWLELQPPPTTGLDEATTKQLAELQKLLGQLEERVAAIEKEIAAQLAKGTPRPNLAMFAYQNGAVLTAIRILEEDQVGLMQVVQTQVMLAGWLMEAGRVEDADRMLRLVEQRGPGVEQIPGFVEHAAYAAWAQGDYARTAKLYEEAITRYEQQQLATALTSGPLTSATSIPLPGERYPALHVAALAEMEGRRGGELATLYWQLAMSRLEQGDLPAAKAALQDGLKKAPDNAYRPLYLWYWFCMTGEELDLEPPADWIPISPDMFSDEG